MKMRSLQNLLNILCNSCCDRSTNIQSYEGGSVSISCSYESEDQNNLQYICSGKQPSTCLQQALITSDNTQNGQFRLTDDKESRKFTVNITSLTQENSGSYLCGVHRNTGLDVFSAAELEVKDPSLFHSVVFIVPAVLLLILIFALIILCKYKCYKVQGGGVNMNRNKTKAADAEEAMGGADIYENPEVATCSKKGTSRQQSTCHQTDDTVALSCVTSAAAVIPVSGYEGRDVNASCSYGEGYESYEKYSSRKRLATVMF
ncbi:polymeric immunoglobulin receptor-like isoform X2 [Lates japonicus]|nr:polymeric immunoglobulin receptor-like isoform X2 [Lates japonicus]